MLEHAQAITVRPCLHVSAKPFVSLILSVKLVHLQSPWRQLQPRKVKRTLAGHFTRSISRATYKNASVDPSRQAVPDQAGDELRCGRAVVPADPGRQRGHRGIVQVQGTAVRGVGIQSAQSRLPDLRTNEGFKDKELCQTFFPTSLLLYLGTF